MQNRIWIITVSTQIIKFLKTSPFNQGSLLTVKSTLHFQIKKMHYIIPEANMQQLNQTLNFAFFPYQCAFDFRHQISYSHNCPHLPSIHKFRTTLWLFCCSYILRGCCLPQEPMKLLSRSAIPLPIFNHSYLLIV